jgi:tetratricopeptide (TPR) repeat protein
MVLAMYCDSFVRRNGSSSRQHSPGTTRLLRGRRHINSSPIAKIALVACLTLAACTESPEDKLIEIRALQNQGRIEESIPLLIEYIEAGHRDPEAMFRYGRALSLSGLPGRGVWALDAASTDPDWVVPASHQIAMDAYRGGNHDFALETLERLRETRPDSHEEDLPALLLEVRVRLESRRMYQEALDLVETILDQDPEQEEAIRLKVVALLGLKETDEAYELIREAGMLASDLEDDGRGEASDGEGIAGTDEGDDAGDIDEGEGGLDLELDTATVKREAYWCAVRATFKREAGETKEATEIIDACLERFPSSRDLMNEGLKLYSALKRYDRVLEILKAAYEDEPDDNEIRQAYVKHLSAIGLKAESESILRSAIDEALTAAKAQGVEATSVQVASRWVDLGAFLAEDGRTEQALDAFGEGLKILGDRASPALLFRQAEALIVAERFDEALEIANRTPIEVHGPMLRGRIAFERGDYAAALEELDGAALMWPDNAPIRYYLARAAEGVGDFDRAIEEYRQAMRSDPDLAAPRERLARLHLAEGRVRHAATILSFVSPKESSSPSATMQLLAIEVQARLGLEPNLSIPEGADMPLAELRRKAIQSLSRGLSQRDGTETAAAVLARLEDQVVSGSKGIFLRERVALLISAGATTEAVDVARKGSTSNPNDPEIRLALGQALVADGSDLEEADTLLRGLVEQWPEEIDAWTSLGDLATLQGNATEANAAYERALEIDPEHWAAFSPRIAGLISAGQEEEAIGRLETFVARDGPYDGRGVLELARNLGVDESNRERRIELAKRAIRFGAGQEAIDLLASLDPEAAAEFSPPTPGVGPAPSLDESGSDANPDADADAENAKTAAS